MLSYSDAEAIGRFQERLAFSVPIQLKRRGVEAKLVMHADGQPSHKPNAKLIAVLADAQRWISDLTEGRAASVRDLARRNNRDAGDVSRTLPLAFLEPAPPSLCPSRLALPRWS
jgi:site-specific DNA recombinase